MQLKLSALRLFSSLPALILVQTGLAAEPARQVPETRPEMLLSFASVVKKVQPAVVNVYVSRTDKFRAIRSSTIRSSGASSAMAATTVRADGPRNR